MINDRLLLDDETEVLLIGTRYQLNKLDHNIYLYVCDNDITSLPTLEIQESSLVKNVPIYTYHQGMQEYILSLT